MNFSIFIANSPGKLKSSLFKPAEWLIVLFCFKFICALTSNLKKASLPKYKFNENHKNTSRTTVPNTFMQYTKIKFMPTVCSLELK